MPVYGYFIWTIPIQNQPFCNVFSACHILNYQRTQFFFSHNHSPSNGCWSHFKMQGVHSTSLQSSVAILSVSHHSHLPKSQSIHFANSSSLIARIFCALVILAHPSLTELEERPLRSIQVSVLHTSTNRQAHIYLQILGLFQFFRWKIYTCSSSCCCSARI